MTTYLGCPLCKYNFALSTTEYMAKGAVCPQCGYTGKDTPDGRHIYEQERKL